jgi:parallel beta-helix repeat protein
MTHSHNKLLLLLFFTFLLVPLAYATDISQSDIPFVIEESGEYNLIENIHYDKSDSAITIKKANNVTLNFNNFSLKLSNHKSTGVLVKKSSEFTITGDAIKNVSSRMQKSNGITIEKSNNGLIQNVFTINNRNGLSIDDSSGITVQNSTFSHATKSGALVEHSTDIAFDDCVFADSHNGLTLSGANKDIVLTNSAFPSASFSNLNVQQVDGMMVDNCSFTNRGGSSKKPNLVQFGDANPEQLANDVIFRNCTIINRASETQSDNPAPEGLGIYQGSGFIVDFCVIDIDNTNQDPAADLSGIHISNPGLGVNGTVASNVIIRNSIIQGPATDGLYPDVGTSGVLIENNLVSGALKDGIFLAGTTGATVIGNTVINNGTNGIFVGETSTSNAIIGNVVNGNGFNPINSSLPPVGNGIAIASDSSTNTVQGNTVFNNAVNGIDDEGTNNQIFGNTAYANASNNYHSATDTITISSSGSAALVGTNISA